MVDDACGLVVLFRLDDEDEDLLLALERLDLLKHTNRKKALPIFYLNIYFNLIVL